MIREALFKFPDNTFRLVTQQPDIANYLFHTITLIHHGTSAVMYGDETIEQVHENKYKSIGVELIIDLKEITKFKMAQELSR